MTEQEKVQGARVTAAEAEERRRRQAEMEEWQRAHAEVLQRRAHERAMIKRAAARAFDFLHPLSTGSAKFSVDGYEVTVERQPAGQKRREAAR